MSDWLKLHRKILDSEVFSKPDLLKMFVWCLAKANWKDGWFDGKLIKAGQFATGRIAGSKELEVSESKFRRDLKKLVSSGMIRVDTNNHFTIITILNWVLYQNDQNMPKIDHQSDHQNNGVSLGYSNVNETPQTDDRPSNRPSSDHPATIQRPSSDHPATTIEERKERKKEKKDKNTFPTDFAVGVVWFLYQSYGHQKAKLSHARKQLIIRRLKEFPVASLTSAIHGIHMKPHNCGENAEGTKYQSLELCLRNAEKIEMFADYYENNKDGRKTSGNDVFLDDLFEGDA